MQTEAVGGTVVLEGESFEEAYAHARRLEGELGLTFVHPFDDPHVAAGQGTVALEMLEDVPELEMLVICRSAAAGWFPGWARSRAAIKPDIGLIGVEAELYPSMYNLLKGTALPVGGDTLAEGIAVNDPGAFTSQSAGRAARRFRAGQRSIRSSARWRCCCRSKRPWSKARALPGWPR